jgi:hypothetical protein
MDGWSLAEAGGKVLLEIGRRSDVGDGRVARGWNKGHGVDAVRSTESLVTAASDVALETMAVLAAEQGTVVGEKQRRGRRTSSLRLG